MVITGVETAGLVLAIFPVAVEGLRFYLRGLESIKRWWRYARAMRDLLRALEMEKVKFEVSCEEILYEIVDTQDLDRLLQAPGGPEWQRPDLQSALEDFLGRSLKVYMAAIAEMRATLEIFTHKLDLHGGSGCVGGSHQLFKDQWRRVRFSLMAEENKHMLKGMEKQNRNLGVLLGHSKRMASLRKPKSSAYGGKYRCLRQDADRLYRAVSKGLTSNCSCIVTHTASLTLEARYQDKYTPYSEGGGSVHNLLFKIFLTFDTDPDESRKPPWIWRETDFEPVPIQTFPTLGAEPIAKSAISPLPVPEAASDTSRNPTDQKGIHNVISRQSSIRGSTRQTLKYRVSFIPSALENSRTAQFQTPPNTPRESAEQSIQQLMIRGGLCELMSPPRDEDSCLGLLVNDSEKHHRVTVKKTLSQTDTMEFVSLESLLSDRFDVERKQSLILAVKLALNVLQLHTTPWLNESWGKQDIHFLLRKKSKDDTLVGTPFVSRKIESLEGPESPQPPSKTVLTQGIRNQSLFSLGVVLIELHFGQTLESLHPGTDGIDNNGTSAAKNLVSAIQLLDDVYRQAGDWYGDAVRRCLYCDFDQRNTSLEDNAMNEAVFRGVILPLRDHLKALCGGQLDDAILS